MHDEIKVLVRDSDLNTIAQLDYFESLTWTERHQFYESPGSWELEINAADPATKYLIQPGSGIQVLHKNETMFSGFQTGLIKNRDADLDQYTIKGLDDSGLLARRVVSPQPATGPGGPYNSQPYDVRTGVASTVMRAYVNANLGPGAIVSRRDPRVTMGPDPGVGSTVTGNGRWQQLCLLLNSLSIQGGGVGYQIRQQDTNLEFQCFAPRDLTSQVVFSEGNGSINSYEYEAESGTGNYIYVGGQGEGTARTIREGSDGNSIIRWGRIENFKDQRDTNVSAELLASIKEELAENSDTFTISFFPIELENQKYFEHYRLGDRVTVVIEDQYFQESISQVTCKLDSTTLTTEVLVGSPNNTKDLDIFDRIRRQNRRLVNLERR